MDTITIPITEYKRLLRAGRRDEKADKKKGFADAAFGILRDDFGKESSISYVAKLRKAWRK
ncbi:MAG: hypothetical protein A3J10_03470 [Candidatus Sungbacteria bacterium RIFCSPLOWO2_02_FULL_54_10]|uniref:Uncharacterized protein n=2 Tax=Candidatus Sungiibacteriota TaxID=1817917 RepID=A0A1G2L4N5_9BACT|nr:MAG: hypothetical protein A2679_02080 [Candidatus Sungbacteria bacterium RIFCSPHIGHO2_01_FULL_54_26]OHA02677.1 MAG: hypothetical protein A3C92_02540 [Candidatus Sungbacteria bacterium RIFCSPHIGHO2_02_FULL_53_17]OHA06530.1 MAG: hypothetical protein A3B34_01280 [Candidatus Sungbacteria bacterium RIFCSPLOWO2_01_FULL_54_21]OHA13441.1 MAG: hypothetical protein A3J10_03470 [Candidatus Sungbacteria bacterium RIFCSPLOWO2_02_FULL_54_10]